MSAVPGAAISIKLVFCVIYNRLVYIIYLFPDRLRTAFGSLGNFTYFLVIFTYRTLHLLLIGKSLHKIVLLPADSQGSLVS